MIAICLSFPRATRDGYAVLASGGEQPRRCIGQVRAGQDYREQIGGGECIEIMTGAPVPAGADAVIMVEYTRREGECVHLSELRSRENIVAKGSEARARNDAAAIRDSA